NTLTNSETVILLKPSVVFFSDRNAPTRHAAEQDEDDGDDVAIERTPEHVKKMVEEKTPIPVAPTTPAQPIAAQTEMILPVRRSPLQDEFATAVQRFQNGSPAAAQLNAPENIKPENGGVKTP
ncbi:MAG TPA: hypothetical protein VHB73_02565, partial [Alphaproteobacteria bacterium]|nr:hypothetical protein [Alphaproteobacteria bacterium]